MRAHRMRNGAEACKLTPCGIPLRAASGRSQASAPLVLTAPNADERPSTQASELAGSAVPQGDSPAQPAVLGPAGGQVATARAARDGQARPALSSLDKQDTTRPDAAIEPTRRAWLGKVERETNPHRIAKAQLHTRRGAQLKAQRLAEGRSWDEAQSGAVWHRRRAEGHIHRFDRVYECGQEPFWIICCECGASTERRRICRTGMLCITCRGVLIQERRQRFILGRVRSVERAKTAGLLVPTKRDRWSEKSLTLTAPHCTEHDVKRRIQLLLSAWVLFLKSLNRWFLEQAGSNKEFVAWVRSFEWTPGNDGKGHPHLHIWLLCPFIDASLVRHFWTCALRTAGYTNESTRRVITHFEACYDADGAARELLKYMTKDMLPDRTQVAPDVFARVYEALDGKRLVQSSSGFFSGIDRRTRCACGAVGCFRRSNTPPEPSGEGGTASGEGRKD